MTILQLLDYAGVAVFAATGAQAFQHDADLLFGRVVFAGGAECP